jgi:hypothetical protein
VARLTKPLVAKAKDSAAGIGALWLGKVPVFGFGDGRLLINGKTFTPHDGGILAMTLAPDGARIVTCGDDGIVVATNDQGHAQTLLDAKGAWLDIMACDQGSGRLGVSAGRVVYVIDTSGADTPPVTLQPARAATALAFSGDGNLAAISHSSGVSLFNLASPNTPLHELPCSGGPVSVAVDHTGAFLLAGLSEPALAGWRLADGMGFRMGGYPGKPRHLVWTQNQEALLTTGGPALLVWPMISKDGRTRIGPMGQAAGVYRSRLGMVTAIACYGEIALVGWSDGGVDLVNLTLGTSRYVAGKRAAKTLDTDPRASTTNIISLAIRQDGKQVAWMSERGQYGTAAIQ